MTGPPHGMGHACRATGPLLIAVRHHRGLAALHPLVATDRTGIFRRAQAERPIPLVQSAWAVTGTTFETAAPTPSGMVYTRRSQSASEECFSSARATPHSASTGSCPAVATATATMHDTCAPGVPSRLMELRNALAHRQREALTPYIPDAWDRLLRAANLHDTYPHIPGGLRQGFLINLPLITHTQSPPNRSSITTHPTEFAAIVADEFLKGRYIGPASRLEIEALLGPFQSSPFSIIPKPGKPGKFRIIQNYSFPHKPTPQFPNPSINSTIDSTDFPTTWGTFTTVSLLLHRLPPGSQIATRDVAEAYRTVPLHHSQWPATVVRIGDDSYGIDTATCFGIRPSAGVYGDVRNAGTDILRSHGIGPITAWVDDHFFIRILRQHLQEYNAKREEWRIDISSRGKHQVGGRIWFGGRTFEDGTIEEFDENCQFPCQDLSGSSTRSPEDQRFAYNFGDIDRISEELGIPWEKAKDQPFGPSTSYIGFEWDLPSLTVSLGSGKKEKYLRAMEEWQAHPTHTLEDVEKLYGKLLHTCLVVPHGRAYLTGLETMLGTCHDRPFVPRAAAKGIDHELGWWASVLRRQCLSRPIPGPVRMLDVGAFSDASSGVGIAIVIRDRWRAWRLIPGWQTLDGKRDIGWAESIGFECLVRALATNVDPTSHYKLYGDNKGVVEGWWNGRSRNRAVNGVFRRIHAHLEGTGLEYNFHTAYVSSCTNPADDPSRGIYPPLSSLLPPVPLPPCLDRFVIDSQEPFSPPEQRAFREGRYPPVVAKRIQAANERDRAGAQFGLSRLDSELPYGLHR
jgi:hypothetical protein